MIKRIELFNFQSHKNTYLDFEDKINIIIGSSNAGKSSIIKALNWLIFNEPNGNEIINYNEKECKVKIEIDNHVIEKIKSDKKNQYIIDNKILNAVGQKVPEEIKEILNFNELNLQMQFDKFFLLQDNSGEVGRKINKIINLEIIDNSIKKIKSKVNKKNQDINYLEDDIFNLKDKLKKYDNLEDFEDKLLKIEKKEIEYNKLSNDIEKLNKLKIEYNLYNISLFKFKNLNDKKEIINKIKKIYNEIKKENEIIILLKQYKEYIDNLKLLNNKIEKLKQDKNNLIPIGSICPVCKGIIK